MASGYTVVIGVSRRTLLPGPTFRARFLRNEEATNTTWNVSEQLWTRSFQSHLSRHCNSSSCRELGFESRSRACAMTPMMTCVLLSYNFRSRAILSAAPRGINSRENRNSNRRATGHRKLGSVLVRCTIPPEQCHSNQTSRRRQRKATAGTSQPGFGNVP